MQSLPDRRRHRLDCRAGAARQLVNTELSQQELEAFRAWQRKQAEEKQEAGAPSSPPKKERIADEEDLAEFERKLTELDINFGDLDPELQNRLRSSTSSRKDFLAIHSTDSCYNPGRWHLDATSYCQEARVWRNNGTRCPRHYCRSQCASSHDEVPREVDFASLDQLYQCCDGFYKMAQHEFALTQYSLERQAAQIQTLERARTNKTVLLMDLPPIYIEGPGQQYAVLLTACKSFLGHCCGGAQPHGNFAHFGGAGGIHHGDAGHDLPRQHATRAPLLAHRRRNDVKLRVEAELPLTTESRCNLTMRSWMF